MSIRIQLETPKEEIIAFISSLSTKETYLSIYLCLPLSTFH